ncbi:hypothetical protein [[Phormidium] sp. ETS-05]|uniref:hypothetical protein n=1 Tax=[Phormidium] sp. ETS-05 TaxID=222819 RepID=UPI001E31080A|nr:hypothetical protein [[Phormidium] sp. ETS-05]
MGGSGFLCLSALFNTLKATILFIYNQPKLGLKYIQRSAEFIDFVAGVAIQGEHYFYYPLILAALYPTATPEQQQSYEKIMVACQEKLKIWAENCPDNFLHKYLLVSAEMARLFGKDMEALDLYEVAIASARQYEYIQNEALGNELLAKFWLGKGKEEIAQVYMTKAHYGYQRWGAQRKVESSWCALMGSWSVSISWIWDFPLAWKRKSVILSPTKKCG